MTSNIIPSHDITQPLQHLHIASIVAHVQPDKISMVRDWLLQQRKDIHAEIHACNAQGKMVIVTESDAEKAIVELLDEFRELNGVLNVSLVYHEYISSDELQEESLLEVQS